MEGHVGLIVFAHGSRVTEANEAVRRIARQAAEKCGVTLWETAFLELAEPDLETAVRTLSAKGVNKIVLTPYFLTMGVHLQRDLPQILETITPSFPHLDLVCSPPLDGHPALVDILADRVRQEIRS